MFSLGFAGALALVVKQAAAGRGSAGDIAMTISIATSLRFAVQVTVSRAAALAGSRRLIDPLPWLRDYAARELSGRTGSVPAARSAPNSCAVTIFAVEYHLNRCVDSRGASTETVFIDSHGCVAAVSAPRQPPREKKGLCMIYSRCLSRRVRHVLTAVGLAGMLGAFAVAAPAEAHGSTTDPPSRVFGCFDRWGKDFRNPAMATQDPMCWQAWQADSNAMWNWSGLNRMNAAGDYPKAAPDGQLCSGGLTKNGRYAAFDKPGLWQAVPKPREFTLTVTDKVGHGAKYVQVYVTKQGYDPVTQPLRWSNLELVTTSGAFPKATHEYRLPVNARNRTGRHVVFAIWLAAHKDESYYMCSDVIFPPAVSETNPASRSARYN